MTPLYRIKPLVWVQEPDSGAWTARTVVGLFNALTSGWYYICGVCDWHPCDSLESGKAAAEAWYRERLVSALEEVGTG